MKVILQITNDSEDMNNDNNADYADILFQET